MELLALGVIIGILVNPAKQKIVQIIEAERSKVRPGETQFIEPVSYKERFEKSKTIDDLLN